MAGHDTVAFTLSWMLYELAKHPDDQKRLRDEIRALRAQIPANTIFTNADLESLPFTNAVIKVLYILRLTLKRFTRFIVFRRPCVCTPFFLL